MKKFNLLFFMLFAICLGGFSQTVNLPVAEDFETEIQGPGSCGAVITLVNPFFINATNDGGDWEPRSGTTTSGSTGPTNPAVDHNPGTLAGKYLYTETSAGCNGNTVSLESVLMNWSAFTDVKVQFWYHMFGATMGTMHFDMKQGNNAWVNDFIPSWTDNLDVWQLQAMSINDPRFVNRDSVQIRVRGITGSSFTSDMAIDDILIEPIVAINTGVSDLLSPVGNICPGTVTPIVEVTNFGSSPIDSVTVVWNINGVLDSLKHIGLILPDSSTSVSLTPLNISAALIYDVAFYTNSPNGVTDQFFGNDTLSIQGLRTGLSGTLTLDASAPLSVTNLTSFAQLEAAVNSFGVCGPTFINVAPGTYNEVISFNNPPGMSPVNTLTIDGGDSSNTFLENIQANGEPVVGLDATSYVTIKNMTLRSTRTATGTYAVVHLSNNSNSDSLVNVRIELSATATFGAIGVLASNNPNTTFGSGNYANFFTMMNSSVDGGDNNIRFLGNGGPFAAAGAANGWTVGNQFLNNTFTNSDDVGCYFEDQESIKFEGNTITDLRTLSTFNGYGIRVIDGQDFVISGNEIIAPFTGINVTNGNAGKPATRDSEISNNMVSCNINSGILTSNSNRVNYWFNSIYCASTDANDAGLYLDDGFGTISLDSSDVRNNAIYTTSAPALRIDEPDFNFTKLDNNAYFNSGGGDLFNIDGAIYPTLAAYQVANTSLNASSLEGDPQYISNTNLRVLGTFINDAGDNSVPITVDIDGDVRPMAGATTVDIGADEFDPPLCPPSVNLGATNVGLTTADIFWTGVTMDYEYVVVLQGAAPSTGTLISSVLDSLTITGLTPSTSYDFYTREICGRGDTSFLVGPYSFNTSNAVPFFEDFETFPIATIGNPWARGWSSTTTVNPRWESEQGTGVNINSTGTGPFYDNTLAGTNGGTYIYLETSGTIAGSMADFRSPGIFVNATQTNVTLEFALHMFGATMGSLEVLVDSNGTENSLMVITGQQQAAQADPYLIQTASLAGYQGKSIELIFRATAGTSFTSDIALDDVRIFEPTAADASVTDIISPLSGCGLGTVDSVIVEISNVGTGMITNFPVVYELNGAAPVTETFTGVIMPGATANFTFNATVNLSVAGQYSLVSYTNLAGDGDITNDSSNAVINSIPIVGGFPYNEGFETGNGGWTVSGISTFALGTPAGSVIASAANGTQSWVTNLGGNYDNNEAGWVESPCLDFSTLVNPVIEMSVFWDSENSWDGAVLQSSTDGGGTWTKVGALGDPDNWYTDNSINGLATLETTQEGWTGTPGSAGWVTAKNVLTGLGGVQGVILRVAFGSDGTASGFEGFAFDDVVIKESADFDMGLLSIETPVSGAYLAGTTDSVRITLANVGADTANNFTVHYVLNGGAVQTETVAQMLPGDTMTYTFNSVVPLPGPGVTSNIDVYLNFALDTLNVNDSILNWTFDNDIKGLPFVEDFENYTLGFINPNGQGGWSSTSTGNPRFEIEDAAGVNENSASTGPFYDATTFGIAGGFYAYLETSGGVLGDQDTLSSPTIIIPASSNPLSLSYSYHMFGSNMGTLEVFIESAGVLTRIDSINGQQQLAGDSTWADTSIALSGAFNGQTVNIVFVGTRGNGFTSDMSIDDISLDFTVGINNASVELEGISVSPNPSNGLFTLNIETLQQEQFNMNVRDAQGRTVYTENLNVNGTYRNDLDFTSFAKGVYYMHIQTETESKVEKLIIQ